MKNIIVLLALLFPLVFLAGAQDNFKKVTKDHLVYQGGESYKVKTFSQKFKTDKPRNVILMIGDGMGVAQVFAGITANHGHLFLENFKSIGFSKTQSFDDYITDSAAGGTAISTGVKTYNGGIGINSDTIHIKTILEIANENGLATGLVSTSSITDATPSSFIAHQPNREMQEEIAADFLKTDINIFIGGGYTFFTERHDGRNLVNELENKGYEVLQNIKEIEQVKKGKLAGLTAPIHNGRVAERGNMLQVASQTAIRILKKDDKGFFLMIEGSQIDWGGHQNNTGYIVEEMLDFDKTIGKALEFAAQDGETLIVVTADHETGGFALLGGNIGTGMVKGGFIIGDHTGVMVPVFAYGPGADNFKGIYENTDVFEKIKSLLFPKISQ